MKKSLLSLAVVAALISPFANAEVPVEPMDMVQKDFRINVKKDPIIIIDPPSMENVDLSFDSLARAHESQKPVYFGTMEVHSTAPSCSVHVMTENGFQLLSNPLSDMNGNGTVEPAFLANYEVVYSPADYQTQVESGVNTIGGEMRFNMNMQEAQQASCHPAELFLAPMEVNHEAPDGVYSDVIRIKVEAEA